MNTVSNHIYIFVSLFFAGLSQIIIRWQMSKVGELPILFLDKIIFIISMLTKPWIWISILAVGISGLFWMITLTKYEISYAYPWTSLLYLYMLVAGYFVFGDLITAKKLLGTLIIIFGVVLIYK